MFGRAAIFFVLVLLTVEAKKGWITTEDDEYRQWQEFKEFLEWKKSKDFNEYDGSKTRRAGDKTRAVFAAESESRPDDRKYIENQQQNPPPIDQAALMGRYIVNQADWTSVATISSRKEIQTFPFANVISFSDGPIGSGSGIPYMYLTPLDFTAQDLAKDNRATLLMTLAQGHYCANKVYDPMDPRCARITLSGKIKTLRNDSAEFITARNAVFDRHPWLAHMPPDHHFYFAKLKIMSIAVLDTFGGPKYVTVKDYLHPPTPNVTEEFLKYFAKKVGSDEEDVSDVPDVYGSSGMKLLQPSISIV